MFNSDTVSADSRFSEVRQWQHQFPGEIPILVPIYNAAEFVRLLLESLERHLLPQNLVVLVDDASMEEGIPALLAEVEQGRRSDTGPRYLVYRNERNLGYGATVNMVIQETAGDLLIVNSDCEITSEWYGEMRSARTAVSNLATASCFSNNGSILSAPNENSPMEELPHGWSLEEYAKRIRANSRELFPTIPCAVGHAWLLTRAAYNLIGDLDTTIGVGTGYGEEVDFSLRAAAHGMANVLVDSAFVFHHGSKSFGENSWLRDAADRDVQLRFPFQADRVSALTRDRASSFCRAKDLSRLFRDTFRLAIDLTNLPGPKNGTQYVALNSCIALSHEFPNLTALISNDTDSSIQKALQARGIKTESVSDPSSETRIRFDVLYRPYHFYSSDEFAWAHRVADRVVTMFLDQISFHAPSYHESYPSFQGFRDLQRTVAAFSDGIACLSGFVQRDVQREHPYVREDVTSIVYLGLDDLLEDTEWTSVSPLSRNQVNDCSQEDILVIGTAFAHKNRAFALRVVSELLDNGWSGKLWLIGRYPTWGSSRVAEERFLRSNAHIGESVNRLETVSDSALQHLFRSSGLLLYPSAVEGFGIPPFEAARHGCPAFTSECGSLQEVMPKEVTRIKDFSVEDTAYQVLRVLGSPEERGEIVEALNRRSADFTWETSATRLSGLFERVLDRPRFPFRSIDSEWGSTLTVESG